MLKIIKKTNNKKKLNHAIHTKKKKEASVNSK